MKMIATVNSNGIEYTASWNGKTYGAAQKRYVDVTTGHSYGSTKMEYVEANGWVKNGGMPYAKAVAIALGFEAAPVVEAPVKVRNPRTKKAASPLVVQLQIPAGKKAHLVNGKIVIK
jgi:hypothetical protein